MKNRRAGAIRSTKTQSDIARQSKRREVVREKTIERASVAAASEKEIEAPPTLVPQEDIEGAKFQTEARGIEDDFGERRGILESQIEALSSDWMDAVSGVARKGEPGTYPCAREVEFERIGPTRAFDTEFAQVRTETPPDFVVELGLRERNDLRGEVFTLRPHQGRPIGRHRQDGKTVGRSSQKKKKI